MKNPPINNTTFPTTKSDLEKAQEIIEALTIEDFDLH